MQIETIEELKSLLALSQTAATQNPLDTDLTSIHSRLDYTQNLLADACKKINDLARSQESILKSCKEHSTLLDNCIKFVDTARDAILKNREDNALRLGNLLNSLETTRAHTENIEKFQIELLDCLTKPTSISVPVEVKADVPIKSATKGRKRLRWALLAPLRQSIADLCEKAGEAGITKDEVHLALGCSALSLPPAFSELIKLGVVQRDGQGVYRFNKGWEKQETTNTTIKPGKNSRRLDPYFTAANALIKRNLIFMMKDLGAHSGNLKQDLKVFLKWAKQHPNLIVGTNSRGHYIFTPYYIENGVKILGTEGGIRNKDQIRGSAARPIAKPYINSLEEKEEVAS